MRVEQNKSKELPTSATFELLRSRIEFEVVCPAVVAITSSTLEDGKESAARGLASSLAATGYKTVFIDSSLATLNNARVPVGQTFDEIVRQFAVPDSASGNLAAFNLSEPTLQRTTSQREIQSGLDILRSKFDYIVISTECGGTTSFATSIINSADAVLVSVKRRRKQKREDARLSFALARIGPRFLGLISFEPDALVDSTGSRQSADDPGHTMAWLERQRSRGAEWPT